MVCLVKVSDKCSSQFYLILATASPSAASSCSMLRVYALLNHRYIHTSGSKLTSDLYGHQMQVVTHVISTSK